jgi:hypothetical protein
MASNQDRKAATVSGPTVRWPSASTVQSVIVSPGGVTFVVHVESIASAATRASSSRAK